MNREKVIAALHCRAYDDDFPCWKCAYYKQDEKPVARCDYRGLMDDAITLLKEQEAVKPRKKDDGNPQPWTSWWYVCGDCGQEIEYHDRYCRWCGRAVQWDG